MNKKRKFVADGVFETELNAFLDAELAEDGYSGCEVRPTPQKTEIVIRATRAQAVLGEKSRRIRELTSLVQKRFGFKEGNVALFVERVANRALCASVQAESIKHKLLEGLPVRRAAYGVLKYIKENGAQGVEIVVSGKLRAQRAKAMKFKDGYMIKSGHARDVYVDTGVRHVSMKQGMLGIRVSIQLPYDPEGKNGVSLMLPDVVEVKDPEAKKPAPEPMVHTPAPQQQQQQQQPAYDQQPQQPAEPMMQQQQQPPMQQEQYIQQPDIDMAYQPQQEIVQEHITPQ